MRKPLARVPVIATAAVLLAGVTAIGAASAHPDAGSTDGRPAMSFATLEQHALKLGIRPSELKIEYGLAEIEGRDADGRKVEIKLDARTGATLRREFDD